jgi:hypothetical protein
MLLQLPISPHEREKEKERSYFSVGPGGSFLSLSSRRARVRADTEDELMARQPVTQTVRILFLSPLRFSTAAAPAAGFIIILQAEICLQMK